MDTCLLSSQCRVIYKLVIIPNFAGIFGPFWSTRGCNSTKPPPEYTNANKSFVEGIENLPTTAHYCLNTFCYLQRTPVAFNDPKGGGV